MPRIEKHAPGSFCWAELATTDQAAAKRFYGSLFGWQAEDYPMGADGSYTMFTIEGRDTAACYELRPGMPIPPNWCLYVATADADDTVTRASELGGRILKDAFDVAGLGRMAVMEDPSGAAFAVWQAKTHIGFGITGENGTLCWADLNTIDREGAKAFYGRLFGWEFGTGKDKSPDSYLHITSASRGIGGILPDAYRNKHAPPHWLMYFLTDDCDASAAKAKQLGARVYVEPMSIDNSLRYSVLADPQGAAFALFARL